MTMQKMKSLRYLFCAFVFLMAACSTAAYRSSYTPLSAPSHAPPSRHDTAEMYPPLPSKKGHTDPLAGGKDYAQPPADENGYAARPIDGKGYPHGPHPPFIRENLPLPPIYGDSHHFQKNRKTFAHIPSGASQSGHSPIRGKGLPHPPTKENGSNSPSPALSDDEYPTSEPLDDTGY